MSNNEQVTPDTVKAVRLALSSARMGTYEVAAGLQAGSMNGSAALALYSWNAKVSSALLAPLHICEVVVRNTVSDALEAVYGDRWPWSPTFQRSLPNPAKGYNPRLDLQGACRSAQTTGEVIPELKFVFWQKMFTSRYDVRIWNTHLLRVMPNLDSTKNVAVLRGVIQQDLESLRRLRNRIAHHEPVFTRNLSGDYQKIYSLVACRCLVTAKWLSINQQATEVILEKP